MATLEEFFAFLDADGYHLTAGPFAGPATEESFRASGYLLRCYLTVRKAMQVKELVLDASRAGAPRSTRRAGGDP